MTTDAAQPPQPPAELLARADTIRIALVRHGETVQNREGVVQGQNPSYGRLTETGMTQARLLGDALAGRAFDAGYCSPLERAVLTLALMLAPRNGDRALPLHFAPELREIHLGALEGRPRTEWHAAQDGAHPMAWRAPGGESWLDVQRRVAAWFRGTLLPAAPRQALIVAHGGVNRALLATLTGLSMGETWGPPWVGTPQDNTCLNDLLIDREGRLLWALVNDVSHLAPHFPGAGPGQLWHVGERRWEFLDGQSGGGIGAKPAGEYDPYG